MRMLQVEGYPKETAFTWPDAHRPMNSRTRKHDDWVNVDCPYGWDRRKARAPETRSRPRMEAQMASEIAPGGAGNLRCVAGLGRSGRCRPLENLPDHCIAICRLGARLRVHLPARPDLRVAGGADRRVPDRWCGLRVRRVAGPQIHAPRGQGRPGPDDAAREVGGVAAGRLLLRLFLTLSGKRERQVRA